MLVQKAILLGSSATTAASVGGVAALLVRLSGCQAVRQLPLYVASVGLRLLPPASRSNPTF
jgi:hypothetical protein